MTAIRARSTRFVVLSGLVARFAAGCASFQRPVGEMSPGERDAAREDQVSLWSFLSGGNLEDAKAPKQLQGR